LAAHYLRDVFPNLSYTVISKLDRAYFDVLYRAHALYAKQPLGEALTKEFILKHAFETVPELIKKGSDLLRALLQRHYRKQQVPASLDEYFLSMLDKTGGSRTGRSGQSYPTAVRFGNSFRNGGHSS
jgi:hypothetical protein